MPQKRILMTEMLQLPKNYQNVSNATIFSSPLFSPPSLKQYQNDLNVTFCSPPLEVLVA